MASLQEQHVSMLLFSFSLLTKDKENSVKINKD
jgi:hypothetical protein